MSQSEKQDALFRKVLVANRGEIAVRVMRTLRAINIDSVAICHGVERNAVHVPHGPRAFLGVSLRT